MAFTVTATQGGSVKNGMVLRVLVLTGTAATQNGATQKASGTSGIGTITVVTTQTGSVVYGATLKGPSAPTERTGTTRIDGYNDATNGVWYGTWQATSPTGTPGSTFFGYTGTFAGSLAGAEILPSGTITQDGSTPAAATTTAATAVTSPSFTPPGGTLLVALIGSDGGAALTSMTVTDTSGLGLDWTPLVEANASSGSVGYAGVWIARMPVTAVTVNAGAAASDGAVTAPVITVPVKPPAGPAASAGTSPTPVIHGGGYVPASLPASAGTAGPPAATGVAAPHPPAPASAGTSPPPVVYGAGWVFPHLAAGPGQAPQPAVQTVLYMGASAGWGRPTPLPGCSQVAVAPPGTAAWRWLGELGHVTALKYSFVMPGGADKMSCTVAVPAGWRTQLFTPGWRVKICRGGHVVWAGRLDEPKAGPGGWAITAAGDGQRAQDFTALWSGTWPSGQPDNAVDQAIARGLPWTNTPGVGQPAWLWFGQQTDPGSVTLAQFLTTACTRGTGTWYAEPQPDGTSRFRITPLPAVPDRLLVITTPVARTLGADVNRVIVRYQTQADSTSSSGATTTAAYATVTVANQAGIDAHQATEAYLDLSGAGVMSAGAATAAGNSILGVYQRISYTGPFAAVPGQLLTPGGQPIDPGTDQAGHVIRAIITDFGYGGEVSPDRPVIFPVGAYEWDDQHQVAQITPFQALTQSFTGLIQLQQTLTRPAATTG